MGLLSKPFGEKEQKRTMDGPQANRSDVYTITLHTQYEEPEVPELQGDYAKAVFLYAVGNASPIKAKGEYTRYFLYECGIRDCPAYHRKLITDGYLRESSIDEVLYAQKLTDLKPLLSSLGLPVSGKKEVLVERLLSNTDEAFLRSKFTGKTYTLSEKGQKFIDEHKAYVKLHQHRVWDIDWKEFDACKRPGLSDNDVIWSILNKRVSKSATYGRNEYLCMYQLLVEEKEKSDALEMLLRVIYIDVSGIEVLHYLKLYEDGIYSIKDIQETFNVSVMLAPGLINDIIKYADVYDDAMVDRLYRWKLPINICSKESFLYLIHSNIDGTFDEDAFLANLKHEFYRVIRKMK